MKKKTKKAKEYLAKPGVLAKDSDAIFLRSSKEMAMLVKATAEKHNVSVNTFGLAALAHYMQALREETTTSASKSSAGRS